MAIVMVMVMEIIMLEQIQIKWEFIDGKVKNNYWLINNLI